MYLSTLKKFGAKNFKAFGEFEVEFPGLTILIGANSSGKSSVLQALLLLKQTVEMGDPDVPLRFDGVAESRYVMLGSFRNVLNSAAEENVLEFWLDLEIPRDFWLAMKFVELILIFTAKEAPLDTSPKAEDLPLYLRFRVKWDEKEGMQIPVGGFHIEFSSKSFTLDKAPEEIGVKRDKFFFVPPNKFKSRHVFLSLAEEIVSSFLTSQVFYLPPLRGWPTRETSYSGEKPLWFYGESGQLIHFLKSREELIERINSWFAKVGVPSKSSPYRVRAFYTDKSHTKIALEISEDGGKTWRNWADVGFGMSQMLPILAAVFGLPEGSLLIMEQPEIHLNPSIEVLLAEALVEGLNRGLRFLVETHSEYILLRLRRRAAEGSLDPEKVALYFVERDWKAGVSHLRRMKLGPRGNIEGWPKDFFGEGLRETLAIAKALPSRKHGRLGD